SGGPGADVRRGQGGVRRHAAIGCYRRDRYLDGDEADVIARETIDCVGISRAWTGTPASAQNGGRRAEIQRVESRPAIEIERIVARPGEPSPAILQSENRRLSKGRFICRRRFRT